jgi:hypothetical protein
MRASSFGGSGDGPTPEQMEAWRRRFATPDNELPGSTAICLLLGRTEDLAVGITAVEAYTAGFSFNLAVRLRSERAGGLGHRLYELIAGHSHPLAEPPAADERLLLGLEYADGRTATNVEGPIRSCRRVRGTRDHAAVRAVVLLSPPPMWDRLVGPDLAHNLRDVDLSGL